MNLCNPGRTRRYAAAGLGVSRPQTAHPGAMTLPAGPILLVMASGELADPSGSDAIEAHRGRTGRWTY